MSKEHEFALYEGENIIDIGTAKELATKLGVKVDWIRHMSTPAHQRKLAKSKEPTGKARLTVKLGESQS